MKKYAIPGLAVLKEKKTLGRPCPLKLDAGGAGMTWRLRFAGALDEYKFQRFDLRNLFNLLNLLYTPSLA